MKLRSENWVSVPISGRSVRRKEMIPHRTASYAGLSLAMLSCPSIFCQIRREYMAFLVQVNDAPTLIRSRAGTSFWRLSQKSVCGVSQGLAHDEVGGVTLRAAPKCLHSKGVFKVASGDSPDAFSMHVRTAYTARAVGRGRPTAPHNE